MKILRAEQLEAVYRRVILALGGSTFEADTFAAAFVLADLRGMQWQGFKSLDQHIIDPIQRGYSKLGQQVTIEQEGESSLAFEARGEIGQVSCRQAMLAAIEKANRTGTCAFAIRHCGDTGLLAGYTLLALEHECIGLMFNNTNPYLAPWGGAERANGIDPLSIAIPAGEAPPILLDMSITPGRLNFDDEYFGVRPFTPPPVKTFATVREYLLSVTLESLVGPLTGMPLGREKTKRGESAVFGLALHIPHFISMSSFRGGVDAFVRQIKATPTAPGVKEILLPGERGFREHARRSVEGVPIDEPLWQRMGRLLESLGVDIDAVAGG